MFEKDQSDSNKTENDENWNKLESKSCWDETAGTFRTVRNMIKPSKSVKRLSVPWKLKSSYN